jgi:hypothetical protein
MTAARFHPLLLGALGLLPFAGLAIGVYIFPLYGPWLVNALLFYGATILAFLGGVHWGVAVKDDRAPAYLYVSGVLPQLLGFGALLAPPIVGSSLLAAGLMAMLLTDIVYMRAQLLPRWFLKLRLVLTFGATASLCAAMPALSTL